MSSPYPPNPNDPSQPGEPGSQPRQPGQQPGQPTSPPGQPAASGYGGYPGYGQPTQPPTQQWSSQPPPNAPWGGAGTPYSTTQGKNFFAKLFDLSFSEFITPSVVKVIYVLAMIGIGLAWISFSIAAFQSSAIFGLFMLLILGPLYALFVLILMRITFEFYVAVIRIAEDVRDIRKVKDGR